MTGIILTIAFPVVLKSRFPVQVPSEIQILAILFGFATLFLGEVRDYYERFWWWDLTLHATARLLLGPQGFMTVYILNEDRHVDLHMKPAILAIFVFCFTQAIGACRLNDVDPQTWLADALARIADHPVSRIDDLLPWNWRAARVDLAA